MSEFREGIRVVAEVTGFIDSDGDMALDVSNYIRPHEFDKYNVRLAPVVIEQDSVYRDADGKFYLGVGNGAVTDGNLRIYGGPIARNPLPVGLIEVQ